VDENTNLVDAHAHFWDPALRHHRWLRGTRLDRPFTPADLNTGVHPIDGFVFVEADCRATEALGEAKWASGLSFRVAPVLGIVAHAPLDQPRALGSHLKALADLPLVVGVRRLLQDESAAAFQSSDLVAGLRALVAFGYTFDACVRQDQLIALRSLARNCPDTQFVLDHVGKPAIAGGSASAWRRDLRSLAACPNVSCKLSGLATEAATAWTSSDIQPYLVDAIQAFGPARCMYGSDWPVALLATTYSRWLETVIGATETLSAEERSAIFADNATRIYGLRVRTAHERTEHAGG
jgi:L-fuconolactonase